MFGLGFCVSMEFKEALEGFERLWFFSNVLSKSTPTQFYISKSADSDEGFNNVYQRLRSWLNKSIEAETASAEEEDEEAECMKGLENAEQSTLIALLMLAPVNSIKPPARNSVGDRGRKKGGGSEKKVKNAKNELFETKRSVLREIQYVSKLWDPPGI